MNTDKLDLEIHHERQGREKVGSTRRGEDDEISLDPSQRVHDFPLPKQRSLHYHKPWSAQNPDPPSTVGSMMKGIVIMSLCAFYTVVLFSCVAAVKSLAILVMGQPLALSAIDFKKRGHLRKFDSNCNRLFNKDHVTGYVAVSRRL